MFEQTDPAGRGPLDRRGLPRRGRAAPRLGRAGRDRDDAAGAGARRGGPGHHRRRRPHQVPRQGGERRGQARRAAGRPARRRDGLPAPAPGRAAVGRRAGHRPQAARPGHLDGRARWRCCPSPRSCRCSARRRAASCTRCRTTATRARSWSVAGAGRSDRSTRSAGRGARAAEIDAFVVARGRPGDPAACGRRAGSAARSCCGCASTTSPAPPGRTRVRAGDRRHARGAHDRPCAAARGRPTIDERGLTCIGVAVTNLADDSRHPARAALRRPRPPLVDLALDGVRDRFGSVVGHPGRAARPRPLPLDADAPRLNGGRLDQGLGAGMQRTASWRAARERGAERHARERHDRQRDAAGLRRPCGAPC